MALFQENANSSGLSSATIAAALDIPTAAVTAVRAGIPHWRFKPKMRQFALLYGYDPQFIVASFDKAHRQAHQTQRLSTGWFGHTPRPTPVNTSSIGDWVNTTYTLIAAAVVPAAGPLPISGVSEAILHDTGPYLTNLRSIYTADGVHVPVEDTVADLWVFMRGGAARTAEPDYIVAPGDEVTLFAHPSSIFLSYGAGDHAPTLFIAVEKIGGN